MAKRKAAPVDFVTGMVMELESVASAKDFCTEWRQKWRPIAIAAQALLRIIFPPGAIVLGFLIEIADKACPSM